MASSGAAITATYYAFIAATNLPKTGDAANIVARVIADGTEATPAGTVTEIDATNCPGLYKVALTGAENTGKFMTLHGKSSTGGVVVLPTFWTNENLPTAAPGAASGVPVNTSNSHTDAYDALTTTTYAESSAVPAATATLLAKLIWICTLGRNKITNTSSQQKLLADDNTTVVGTAAVADDGATASRGKFA